MKRKISLLLIVCVILPMTLIAAVPTSAAVVAGGGVVAKDESGVYYRFADVEAKTGSLSYYNYYKTGDGIVFANYGNSVSFSNDTNGNLIAALNSGTTVELTFVSGFAYPNTQNWGAFYDITAIAIRYKVLNQTSAGTATFKGVGSNGLEATSDALELRTDGEWVEAVYALTAGAKGNFGGWKVFGDSATMNQNCKLSIAGLSSGATLVLDYIGLYYSVAQAQAAQDLKNGVPTVDVPAGDIFSDSVTVSVKGADGTSVYYTTDGTDPSATNGQKYTTALTFTEDTCLKLVPYWDETGTWGAVYAHNYHFSANRTYISKRADGRQDAQVIRLTGIKSSGGNNWSTDCGIIQQAPPSGRDFYNDAEGNLVMVTKGGSLWDPLCLTKTKIYNVCPTIVEMRYKTTDSAGALVTPPSFADGAFTVKYNNGSANITMTVKKSVTTAQADGWYVTRIYFDGEMYPVADNGTTSIIFPATDTSMVYVIDYVGFFLDEAAADANTKRDRVFDDDAVKLYGAQANKDANDVRFIGVIDDYASELYQEFGFKISVGGKTATAKIEKYVYAQIMADGVLADLPANFVTGQNDQSKFFTFCVNDIPLSACTDGKLIFEVCAYAKIKGAEICGSTSVVEYDYATKTVTVQ